MGGPAIDEERRVAALHRRHAAARATRRSIRSTPSNFNKLEVAWRFKTDNLGPRPEYKLEGTPLMVKGVLYTTGGTRRSVVALDGEDRRGDLGAQPARGQARRRRRRGSCRAAASRTGPTAAATSAILYVTTGYRLVALNAKTGALDQLVRHRRHRRSEGRRGVRQRPADRSRDRRDRRALDAGDRRRTS